MTSTSQWIAEARDHLEGDQSFEANQLASPYVAAAGTLAFTQALGNIGAGAWLSIGTNTFLVLSVDAGAKTATVLGGQRGTTDANAASGALVRVNPRFSDFQIVTAINRHLATLSSPTHGLYRVGTALIDYTDTVDGYDLDGVTGLIRALEVRRQKSGTSLAWPRVPTSQWDVDRSADTTDFPSGMALRFLQCLPDTGYQVQLVYARSFTAVSVSDLTADVSTSGISAEAEDIPPLGAAVRLMSGREVPRNITGTQGGARRSQEVPPGAVANSYRGLLGLWQQRVQEENARLRAMFPLGK